jgi:hypothetical protein
MKLFYYQNSYCRLVNNELVSMTPGEAEAFCLTHRDTTLVGFIPPSEARSLPAFWSHSDLRVKVVRLDESFRGTITPMLDRELSGCYELVRAWLLSIDPTMISYTSQIPA